MASQSKNGKAFEYITLKKIYDALSENQEIEIIEDSSYRIAKYAFEYEITDSLRENQIRASELAIEVILDFEPQLGSPDLGTEPLSLSIQSDNQGQRGDVRDVICLRSSNNWEIGISCKNNHRAVKHSRLSDTIDFGERWFGYPCSDQYWNEVLPIFQNLRTIRDESNGEAKWRDLEDKESRVYEPVLQAFISEMNRLNERYPDIGERLTRYLIGENDFYKVITNMRSQEVSVEMYNLNGTLNLATSSRNSRSRAHRTLPASDILRVDWYEGRRNTVEMICDRGWQFNMRIHNASSRIEPSLKFDIQLTSAPNTVTTRDHAW